VIELGTKEISFMSGLIACPRPMTKVEAMQDLGYDYAAARGVWTSERDDRVLITLWDQQIRRLGRRGLYQDEAELHPPGSSWHSEAGLHSKHMKRAERLRRVMAGEAELDVVILFGPVQDTRFATSWRPEEQDGLQWSVVSVNDENGFFYLEAVRD